QCSSISTLFPYTTLFRSDLAERNGKALFVKTGANDFETAYLSTRDVFWDGYQKEGIWLRPATNRYQWEIHASPRAISGTAYNGRSEEHTSELQSRENLVC